MLSHSIVSKSLQSHGLYPTKLHVHGDSPGKNTEGVAFLRDLPNPGDLPPPGDLPNPGMEARSSTLQADSLPSEPPGKP